MQAYSPVDRKISNNSTEVGCALLFVVIARVLDDIFVQVEAFLEVLKSIEHLGLQFLQVRWQWVQVSRIDCLECISRSIHTILAVRFLENQILSQLALVNELDGFIELRQLNLCYDLASGRLDLFRRNAEDFKEKVEIAKG